MRTWLLYWLFVIVSWSVVGFYVFISGWAPCEESGTCVAFGLVAAIALLLMPAQVLIAAYLKQRDD